MATNGKNRTVKQQMAISAALPFMLKIGFDHNLTTIIEKNPLPINQKGILQKNTYLILGYSTLLQS
jgi:hypothetical protein